MKVLVLGGMGLLGEALVEHCRSCGHTAIAASRSSDTVSVDIADRGQLAAAVDRTSPDLVINCAAIASIDGCEADPARAHAVNAQAVADLVELSRARKFKLVHVSTDHFFTGDGRMRHDEASPVTLVNEYARSKLAAEQFAAASPDALVVRTAFVGRHSRHDQGFAEQIYGLLRRSQKIVLFEDAYTSLLHRAHVAAAILSLAERDAGGVVNVASRDVFSKADLIRAFAARLGLPLNGEAGSVMSLRVPRAESLGLLTAKVESLLRRAMPSFEDTVGMLAGDFSNATLQHTGSSA